MTIPDHYRQWAAKEAEKDCPNDPEMGGMEPWIRSSYERALLRMWPLVDALQKQQHINDCEDEGIASGSPDKSTYLEARDAIDATLSSLNLPKVNSNGEDQE